MDFTPVINDLRNRAAALNSAIATLVMMQAGDEKIKFDSEVAAMPHIIQDPQPNGNKQPRKAKVVRLAKKAKPAKTGNKRAAILEYLQQHPGSGAVAIARALGFSRSATTWNLSEARDAGLVRIDGRSSNAKWSLVNQKSTQRIPPPEPREEDEPGSGLACKFCHAPCASPERLERHMKIVHGKTT
jgi:hypothetical protein